MDEETQICLQNFATLVLWRSLSQSLRALPGHLKGKSIGAHGKRHQPPSSPLAQSLGDDAGPSQDQPRTAVIVCGGKDPNPLGLWDCAITYSFQTPAQKSETKLAARQTPCDTGVHVRPSAGSPWGVLRMGLAQANRLKSRGTPSRTSIPWKEFHGFYICSEQCKSKKEKQDRNWRVPLFLLPTNPKAKKYPYHTQKPSKPRPWIRDSLWRGSNAQPCWWCNSRATSWFGDRHFLVRGSKVLSGYKQRRHQLCCLCSD